MNDSYLFYSYYLYMRLKDGFEQHGYNVGVDPNWEAFAIFEKGYDLYAERRCAADFDERYEKTTGSAKSFGFLLINFLNYMRRP